MIGAEKVFDASVAIVGFGLQSELELQHARQSQWVRVSGWE